MNTEEQTEAPEVVAPTVEVEQPEQTVETTEETTSEDNEEQHDDDLSDDRPRGKNAQSRIAELTRARREAERERDFYKGLATQTAPNPTQEVASKPTADQFEDYGEYVEALTDWKVGEAAKNTRQTQSQLLTQANWSSKVEAVKSTHADYDTVVGTSDIDVTNIRDALMEADRGPELAYYLAQNPTVAERLNGMSQHKAAMELGRLEAQLAAPVVKPATKAPAPISPVRAGSSGKVTLANADMETFIAERRKQGARY